MTHKVYMIDPPWPKKKGGLRRVRPNQDRQLDYETMSVPEIFSLLDAEIFPDEPHTVFLWCVESFLLDAENEMSRRKYKRHVRFIWNKLNGIAPAFTVRYSHEYLIWMYKPPMPPISSAQRGKFLSVFESPGREHSRKPDCAYEMVSLLYPNAKKWDVFSREKRRGWAQWGNQPDHFNNAVQTAP